MGYWDNVFADQYAALNWAAQWLPEWVNVGNVPISREEVAQTAFGTPYSLQGVILKTMVGLQQAGANQAQIAVATQGLTDIASSSGKTGIQIGVPGNMAQLIIANAYRCAIQMVCGGRDVINVVHVEGSAPGQEAAAAAAVLAAWKVATGPLTQLSNYISMVEVQAMDLSSASGGIYAIADTTTGGIAASQTLATRAASALIKWNGGTRSRSSRGRLYYGPLRESNVQIDGATLESAAVTAFGTAFTAFRNSLSAAGFPLQVASRLTSSCTSVTSQTVESTIATQRRRIRS